MDTITVDTVEQAHFLRLLNDASEAVIEQAQVASRKMLDVATQVGEGNGFPVDFSASAVDRYREALIKRATLLEMVRALNVSVEALESAAQGRGVWFVAAK